MVCAISFKYIELRIRKKRQKLIMKPGKNYCPIPCTVYDDYKKGIKGGCKDQHVEQWTFSEKLCKLLRTQYKVDKLFLEISSLPEHRNKITQSPSRSKKTKKKSAAEKPTKKINQRLAKGHPHKKERVNQKSQKLNQVARKLPQM